MKFSQTTFIRVSVPRRLTSVCQCMTRMVRTILMKYKTMFFIVNFWNKEYQAKFWESVLAVAAFRIEYFWERRLLQMTLQDVSNDLANITNHDQFYTLLIQ